MRALALFLVACGGVAPGPEQLAPVLDAGHVAADDLLSSPTQSVDMAKFGVAREDMAQAQPQPDLSCLPPGGTACSADSDCCAPTTISHSVSPYAACDKEASAPSSTWRCVWWRECYQLKPGTGSCYSYDGFTWTCVPIGGQTCT